MGDGSEMLELVGMLAEETHAQPEFHPWTLRGSKERTNSFKLSSDHYTYFCTYTYKINKNKRVRYSFKQTELPSSIWTVPVI